MISGNTVLDGIKKKKRDLPLPCGLPEICSGELLVAELDGEEQLSDV